ncbi:MAG: putative Histidine kinase [Bacteriovoracaceae bacterium]|nr:putative Histidine kinase [Bacteriovoracaceae bacterium]
MKHEITLKTLLRKVVWKITLNSVLLSVVAIVPILTVAFLNAEQNKLELLTQELAAIIKPKIQIGDEIEIRGDLSKSLETTNAVWLSVSAKQIRPLVASKLSAGPDSLKFQETGFWKVLFNPYIVQVSSFKIYPNSPEMFSIKVVFPNTIRPRVLEYMALTAVAIAIALLMALLLRSKSLLVGIGAPLENLKQHIENFDPHDRTRKHEISAYKTAAVLSETEAIKSIFDSLQGRIEKQQEKLLKKSVEEERGRMAAQLGHDLKSYTSIIINMIETLRSKISEEDLLILQKSASDISIKMQQLQRAGSQSLSDEQRSYVLQLTPYIAHMAEMKSVEYLHDRRINIRFDFLTSEFDVFSRIDPVEFRTAISNLINNSVEAIAEKGEVVLSVKRDGEHAVVEVRDTGRGIPREQVDRVGQYGFSTKEGSDRGTGLAKAIEIIKKGNGEVFIDSTEGVGTSIKLRFLAEWSRNSFVKEIDLLHCDRVIIMDNDESFAGRLKKLINQKCPQMKIVVQNRFENFKSWAESNTISSSDLVLMDYDLQESEINKTGLDLIEMFNLQERSILLTHNDSDSRLLDECDRKNIRLLPKILIKKIKFIITPMDEDVIGKYDGSVIDDNGLHIINLKKAAKAKGLTLRFYRRASEFLKDARKLDPNKPILVDSQLENGERGEIHAKGFYDDLGFHEIMLNTASAPEDFQGLYSQGMYWIKGIISKEEKAEKIVEYFV